MAKKFTIRDIDKGMRSIVREVSKATEPYVNVGVLSDAGKYAQQTQLKRVKVPKGEAQEGGPTHRYEKGRTLTSEANLADVATWMEFGTRSIPARPFMKQAFDQNFDRIYAFVKNEHAKFIQGKQTMEMGLKRIGVFFEGLVKKGIVAGPFAALKPATIKRKGSSKPLIDTGRLRQSITNKVVMNPGAGGGDK